MGKIQLGDIFEIDTPKGKAYLHYIYKDDTTGQLIRVLSGLYSETPESIEKLAETKERYMVFFPLEAANKKSIVRVVGNYPIDHFKKPNYMRTEHNVRGEFLGWHIVDIETWQRQLVKSLTPEHKQLSPWGIWNDTLLIERLVNDWRVEDWG